MTATAIVLLPGLDGTGTLFRPFLPYIEPSLRPIVVRYPENEQLGYDALLDIVIRALPTQEPFVILGESFSGPLALMAAATRPPGLEAVVLCATFIRNPLWIRASFLRHLVHPSLFRFYPLFSAVKTVIGGYSSPELRASIAAAVAAVSPRVVAHRVHEVLEVDASAPLQSCTVPILYLRGNRDLVVPGHNAREVAAASKLVTVTTLKSPHLILQTRPLEAATAIVRFLEKSTKSF